MEQKLKEILKNSYSPYSNFKVAAIAIMKDGREFKGVNVENASYGACNCAERSAIFSAISNGYTKGDFNKLYVMCQSEQIGTPCFICRQVISEMFEKDKEVVCFNPKGEYKIFKVRDLCPYPFDDETLNS